MKTGDKMSLDEQVVNKLSEKNYHISFAESCTGGLCCGTLVNVSNASRVLDMSFVTYANEAKIALLGVSADTISRISRKPLTFLEVIRRFNIAIIPFSTVCFPFKSTP